MNFNLLLERQNQLQQSINNAFVKMKVDYIAKQLEDHDETKKFGSNRLNEILVNMLNDDREKYIRKLSNDLEESLDIKNKLLYKLERAQLKVKIKNDEVSTERGRLTIMKRKTQEKINGIHTDDEKMYDYYKNEILKIRNKTKLSQKTLSGLDSTCFQVKQQLNSMKQIIKQNKDLYSQELHKTKEHIANNVLPLMSPTFGIDQVNNDIEIVSKTNTCKKLHARNIQMQKSLNEVIEYINTISKVSIETNIQNIGDFEIGIQQQQQKIKTVLVKYYDKQEENFMNKMLLKSGSPYDIHEFISQTVTKYNEKMKQKEKEYDEVIKKAKQRRKQLEQELTIALKRLYQLADLRNSSEDENIYNELQRMQDEYKARSNALSHTMNLLAAQSGTNTMNSSVSQSNSTLGASIFTNKT